MNARLAVAALCLWAGAAFAQPVEKYYLVAITANNAIFLEKDGLRLNEGGMVTGWTLSVFHPDLNGVARYSLAREAFDCNAKTTGAYSLIYYRFDGAVIDSADTKTPKLSPVKEGSMAELVLKAACSGLAQPLVREALPDVDSAVQAGRRAMGARN